METYCVNGESIALNKSEARITKMISREMHMGETEMAQRSLDILLRSAHNAAAINRAKQVARAFKLADTPQYL